MRKNAEKHIGVLQKCSRVILLVGDTQDHTQLIKRLHAKGIKAILSKDATDAYEKLRSITVDFIITHLVLPNMDCLEFIISLKELHLDIPLIIITDNADEISDNLPLINTCASCQGSRKGENAVDTRTRFTKLHRHGII